jgi:hypothetical protein
MEWNQTEMERNKLNSLQCQEQFKKKGKEKNTQAVKNHSPH